MSVTVRVPVTVPTARGMKVTAMLQEAPAATLAPQLLVSEKPALACMLLMLSSAFPVFVSDTVWALVRVNNICEANVKEEAERVTAGPAPVPMRPTV